MVLQFLLKVLLCQTSAIVFIRFKMYNKLIQTPTIQTLNDLINLLFERIFL